ncbi:glycine--tRNA ligase subunit beta [Hydrogenophaga sp. SNF1]|uniref:glycine--tRNA ligase subunit beta n=1 Tax=Hydrogenophaga sp. SNF1 TaxID=3098762 RepID=UPI002ACC0808|nr:glycine--tRNA ligase subunit beta [Hydrogenophaga sp. SNF1]WQB84136.1 glycine--tRNA ligase subunit beta [Hydrogenophaga sp. SNF1]
MSAQNLLVELFVEELPPKALKKLGEAFATGLAASLQAQGLAPADAAVTAFASPRRLAAHVAGVLARAADKPQSHKLMPVSVGLDASGQPTPALLKRLGALGADASAVAGLRRAVDGKAEALFFDSIAPGVELAAGLQKALDEAIAQLPIPKVMTYQLESGCALPGWDSVQFVRPAHGLVALHGAEVVPVKALGLKAGNATHGHRFEARVDPVAIAHADAYADTLAQDGAVIASFAERRAEIARQLAAAAAQVGGACRPVEDEALLDEVTALVERPNVLICEFEKQFLDVPQECLILTMKANQKYFPLLDAQGRLTNRFLVVSNIRPDDASAVIGGNERVVRPRLADAKFFFDQDRKKTLESRVEGLGKVVYHNQLGTQGERVERVRAIARAIGQRLGGDVLAQQADTAARLAKTDLLTDMVGEFPELQGIMGGYYARHDGLSEDIAFAIEDHYKPRFAGDALPRNAVGTVVALADKLETLVGMFGIGNLPTGDKDPFALRRHALGVVRMLIEADVPVNLDWLLGAAAVPFGTLIKDPSAELEQFIYERLRGYFRDEDRSVKHPRGVSVPHAYTNAEIDAVLALRPQLLRSLDAQLHAVLEFASLPEAPALAAANKRIGNILKKSEGVGGPVNAGLLKEPAEKALFDAMQATVPGADARFEAGDFTASLQALAALRAPVDAFFDGVMVNADDPALKANRLALLQQLHRAMNRVADLSRLAA